MDADRLGVTLAVVLGVVVPLATAAILMWLN